MRQHQNNIHLYSKHEETLPCSYPVSPHLCKSVQEVSDGPDARDLDRVLHRRLGPVHVDQDDGAGPQTALWQGEAEVHDGIELAALTVAARADQCGAVHSL